MGASLRRKRGTGISNVQSTFMLPRECKDKLREVSRAMGISDSQGLELLITNLSLDADGLPAWADHSNISEALPIAKAS